MDGWIDRWDIWAIGKRTTFTLAMRRCENVAELCNGPKEEPPCTSHILCFPSTSRFEKNTQKKRKEFCLFVILVSSKVVCQQFCSSSFPAVSLLQALLTMMTEAVWSSKHLAPQANMQIITRAGHAGRPVPFLIKPRVSCLPATR